MEKILGVEEASKRMQKHVTEGSEMLGDDTTKADLAYDDFGNDEARHRYQRLFWEPHAETAVCPSFSARFHSPLIPS